MKPHWLLLILGLAVSLTNPLLLWLAPDMELLHQVLLTVGVQMFCFAIVAWVITNCRDEITVLKERVKKLEFKPLMVPVKSETLRNSILASTKGASDEG